MKLWSPRGHFRGNKVLLTAELTGITLEYPNFTWKDAKSKEFVAKNPSKSIPLLELENGTTLIDSTAMMIYICQLAQSPLYSGTPEVLAEIDSWLEIIQTQIEPAICNWIYPYFGLAPADPKLQDKSAKEATKHLKAINKLLAKHKYLCGDELSIADIALVSALVYPFRMVVDENQRKSLNKIVALFTSVTEMPHFKNVWGTAVLCKTPIPLTEAKAKKAPAEKKKQEQEKKKAEPKPKPEPKKKEEKKAESKEPELAQEDGEKKKSKNPLDDLPPTTFELDPWKKLYSNTPDRHSVMPEFWNTFDKNGWSIWRLRYQKLEGECQKVFMTCNTVEGFLQRMEGLRRYAFGTMGVYGDEPNLEVMGVFMWRGKGIPQEMLEHPSFEYHDREEMDPDNPDHRRRVEEYWCNLSEQDKVDGLTPREVRAFK